MLFCSINISIILLLNCFKYLLSYFKIVDTIKLFVTVILSISTQIKTKTTFLLLKFFAKFLNFSIIKFLTLILNYQIVLIKFTIINSLININISKITSKFSKFTI